MFILVQALVTAILSGLFSGAVIFALNERRDRDSMLLRKTEEAIEAFIEWSTCLEVYPSAHMSLFISGNFKACNDRLDMLWEKSYAASNKARMLIAIYLPDQLHVMTEFAQSYQDFMVQSGTAKSLAVAGKPAPADFLQLVNEAGEAIVKAGSRGAAQLAAAGRARAHGPYLVRWPHRKKLRN